MNAGVPVDPEHRRNLDVREFRTLGYLQEVNRLFMHPLGLALSVAINEDGTEQLGPIWDYRDDPEGLGFAAMPDLVDEMHWKAARVEAERAAKVAKRAETLDAVDGVQPLPARG